MQLIWQIFFAILAAQVIGWVGKKVLVDLCFGLYSSVALSGQYRSQKKLKQSIFKLKHELASTSAQDQYARWTKMRRQLDKELAELEKMNGSLSTSKSGFERVFSSFLWVLTFALPYVLVWYNRQRAVFYLPEGWTPNTLAWLISKKGKTGLITGSVSTTAWSMVCRRVIATGEELAKAWLPSPAVLLAGLPKQKASPKLTQPIPSSSGSPEDEKKPGKKDL